MKTQLIIWHAVIIGALLLPKFEAIDDYTTPAERSRIEKERDAIAYGNPLQLNNKPVNYSAITMASKGILSVVAGHPETAAVEKIPFRIYLLRDGKKINNGPSDATRPVTEIDIAAVLYMAKPNDNLIIEPVRESDSKSGRNIKLKSLFDVNLLSFLTKKGDGC